MNNPLADIFAEANKANDQLVEKTKKLHNDAKKSLKECKENRSHK